MITFRFYVVTLVAVFLAIALGVVIGSTFIEPALVDNLRNQVDSVRGDLDRRVATIDDLNHQVDGLQTYVDQSAPFAVQGTLNGTTALVVAEDGVNGGAVERLVGRMRQAGGRVDGIVWVKKKAELSNRTDVDDLRTALGLGASARVTWAGAWQTVLTETGGLTGAEVTPPTSPTTTTSTTGDPETTSAPKRNGSPTTVASVPMPGSVFETPTLKALSDAGFVRLQRIQESGKAVTHPPISSSLPFGVVLVTGPDSHLGAGVFAEQVAREQAALDVPSEVAEVWKQSKDGSPRGAAVAPVRADGELSARVATIDDLDLVQGQVAAVAAMADLGRGIAGHYGYGKGAGRVLPEWLGP